MKDHLIDLVCELHTARYGPHPSHTVYADMTIRELEDMIVTLSTHRPKNSSSDEDTRFQMFNDMVGKIMKCGAGDRKTALQWMLEGHDISHPSEIRRFVWQQGLRHSRYEKSLIGELMDII